jgi:SOS response associated peptidase (SRAP)
VSTYLSCGFYKRDAVNLATVADIPGPDWNNGEALELKHAGALSNVRPLRHHDRPRGHAPVVQVHERHTEPAAQLQLRTNPAAAVVRLNADAERDLMTLKWGLILFGAKDVKIAYSTINARAETVAHKPAFQATFKARRCWIPGGS